MDVLADRNLTVHTHDEKEKLADKNKMVKDIVKIYFSELVVAMNPCPWGYYGNEKCKCSDYEIVKYRQKISGSIMNRMDIQNT